RSIENAMVIRFQADADILVFHYSGHSRRETWQPRRAARKLSSYAGDDAGADGAAAFADRETQAFVHGDRRDQLDIHRHVIARHHHLRPFGKRDNARHVRRAEVELRTVVREERRMTAAFFLRQDVGFSLELRVRGDRARTRQNLAALNILALRAAQQHADVVTGLALIEQLAEHFNARAGRLRRRANADNLDFLANLDHAALDTARYNR